MATLRQIVDSILTTYSGGRRSNDDLPDRNWIIFKLLEYRATYVRRDIERNQFISNQLEQDLGCIEIEVADAAECCDVEADCTVFRTAVTIPNPVRLNNKDAFTYIGAIDKTNSFKQIRPYEAKWAKYNKYTKGKSEYRAYYMNNRIYVVTDNPILEYINVRGVFFDPRDTRSFTCDDVPCYTEDTRFPMGDDMTQSITMEILTKELGLQKQTDVINNLIDDQAGENR
jgi:hypothetical protein